MIQSSSPAPKVPPLNTQWNQTVKLVQSLKGASQESSDAAKGALKQGIANMDLANFAADENRKLNHTLRQMERHNPPVVTVAGLVPLRSLLQELTRGTQVKLTDKSAVYSLLRSSVSHLHPDKQARLGPLSADEQQGITNLFLLLNTAMQVLASAPAETFAVAMAEASAAQV